MAEHWTTALAEKGFVPDILIRRSVKALLKQRLHDERRKNANKEYADWLHTQFTTGAIAYEEDQANRQHYEVRPEFFENVLGPYLKYSCGMWMPNDSLAQSEERMLALTCEHARIEDGQRILELGCGWGSLTIWLATHYPKSRITAISNSNSQREFIEKRCKDLNLTNITILTKNINEFDTKDAYDRIVSVEMFEHLRNYREIFARASRWLAKDGKLFIHIFCNRRLAYLFATGSQADWMGRNFFTGGSMPSYDLFTQIQDSLTLEERQWISGTHYQKTCEAWLRRADKKKKLLRKILAQSGEKDPSRALRKWRMFFIACSELFGFQGGEEWGVGHYLFSKNQPSSSANPSGKE